MTREQLINYYEGQLEKVKAQYGDDWRFADYVKHAEENLDAVKNGRMW